MKLIIFLKIFPPKNSEMSIMSEPTNFLYNLYIMKVKINVIIPTYKMFKAAAEPEESKAF